MEIDVSALKQALQPGHQDVRQTLKKLLAEPLFTPRYNLSLEEERRLTRQRLVKVAESGVLRPQDYTEDPGKIFAIHETLVLSDSSLTSAFTIQFNILVGSLSNLSTGRHSAFISEAMAMRCIGCFALTEIGYGSNAISIETTSTYDPTSQTFELHTPNIKACKFWVSGNKPTHGVIFAKLITPAGDQGIQPFFTRLRAEDGSLLPGVEELDLGAVSGPNGVGSNLLRFTRFRIPLDSLMDRYASVSPDGTFSSQIANKRERFLKSIERLSAGRICMTVSCLGAAKLICLIVHRYASQRLAVGPEGKSDAPIMSYQLQQNALVPYFARIIALEFGAQYAKHLFTSNDPFLSTFICVLKPLAGWTVNRFSRIARERMGGAGFLSVNRMSNAIWASDSVLTAEGDNAILMIKVATDLIKQAMSGKYTPPQLSMCPVRHLPNVTDFSSLDLLLELLRAREVFSFRSLSERMQKSSEAGASLFEITSQLEAQRLQHLSKSFGERILAEKFLEAIAHNPRVADVLSLAALLYMLDAVKDDLGWLMTAKLVSAKAALSIVEKWTATIKQFSPLLTKVVEGFDIPADLVNAPAAGDYVGYNDLSLGGELLPKL
jgi:acyl-CoA oxidase